MIHAFEVPPCNMQEFSQECGILLESWANRKILSATPTENGNFIVIVESDSGPTTSVISKLRDLSVAP